MSSSDALQHLARGSYFGDQSGANKSQTRYTIRLMDDGRCWLDCSTTTPISSSSWHVEGPFAEEAAADGTTVGSVRFTVDQCHSGGGPKVGSVHTFEHRSGALIFEGVTCDLKEGLGEIGLDDYMQPFEAVPKAAPVPAPKASSPAPPVPDEGAAVAMPTKITEGSAAVVERTVAKSEPETATTSSTTEPAAAVPEGFFTLEQLHKESSVWKDHGIDSTRREEYLTDDTFMKLFEMSKVDFAKLPKWKRDGRKKELGLF